MRDPLGHVEITASEVLRHAYKPLPQPHFLDCAQARGLVAQGMLTPYEFRSRIQLRARKLPFVSYPWEWTHEQFWTAATTTLTVAEAALREGHELKDASAFNILFDADRAEFCDHFSFQPIRRRQWWAYGQFARHFLFPLAASCHAGIEPADTFKTSLDGLSLERAKVMLGWRRWHHRIGLAFLQSNRQQKPVPMNAMVASAAVDKPLHGGVLQFLRWQLSSMKRTARASAWADYEATRSHYQPSALEKKREVIGRWLERTQSDWVADLGCNQGEFSLIAARTAKGVIAIDSDPASIQQLRKRLSANTPIHTACAALDDLPNGRGWRGEEYAGLVARIRGVAATVMALALIHHLAIGRSIPLAEVAQLMSDCTRRFLAVEYVDPGDAMVVELLRARDRQDASAFSLQAQRAAFASRFRTIEELQIEGSTRWLALLEKHEPD